MLYNILFNATLCLFCVAKNILNKGAAPHSDLRLSTLLLFVEIQCPLHSGEDSGPARLNCGLCLAWVDRSDR
jgi:hypothetical protein